MYCTEINYSDKCARYECCVRDTTLLKIMSFVLYIVSM